MAEYSSEWPALFRREAERVRAALCERVLVLEHVGSTSVPGLAAKPIIDMVLALRILQTSKAILPGMEASGYVLYIREPGWYQHRLFKDPDTNINLQVTN